MLQIPEGIQIHYSPTSTWWVDKEGIICITANKFVDDNDTVEIQEKRLEEFDKAWGDRKACVLMDVSAVKPEEHSKEYRMGAAGIFNKKAKAVAIIAPSLFNRTIVDVFYNLEPPVYPYKHFETEKEAREWLKQFCG
jgi:hypothetical protein